MTGQRGFTVVEVLVAMLVLSIGVLGMTLTAALATRMVAEGHRYSAAAAIAHERMEILRSQSCAAMTSGSTSGTYGVAWTVDAVADAVPARELTVSVTSPGTSRGRTYNFSTTVACEA